MTVQPGRAGSTRRGSVLLLVLLLSACGVDAQRVPERVPADRLPSAVASTGRDQAALAIRVWGARDQRLVPVSVEVDAPSSRARVEALLALTGQTPPSVLPRGCRLLSSQRQGDLVELTLSDELRRMPRRDMPLALGQLVLTVTEHPDVRRVRVRVPRQLIPFIDATGRTLTRPLTREDFAGFTVSSD